MMRANFIILRYLCLLQMQSKNDLFIMIGWLILPPHPTLPTTTMHLLHMNH